MPVGKLQRHQQDQQQHAHIQISSRA